MKQGAGSCDAPYLARDKLESLVVDKLRGHILVEEHLRELVRLVGEEMDSDSAQAMTLGETFLITEAGNERLGRLSMGRTCGRA